MAESMTEGRYDHGGLNGSIPPPATRGCHLPPETEASNSRGNRRPDDWLGSLIMAEANFPVSGLPLSGVNLPTANRFALSFPFPFPPTGA
jgi:hypothetical protein